MCSSLLPGQCGESLSCGSRNGGSGKAQAARICGQSTDRELKDLKRDHLESLVDGFEDMWLTLRTA